MPTKKKRFNLIIEPPEIHCQMVAMADRLGLNVSKLYTAAAIRELERRGQAECQSWLAQFWRTFCWSAEVIDKAKVPLQYMQPDMTALNKLAREYKGTLEVPGVKFISKKEKS